MCLSAMMMGGMGGGGDFFTRVPDGSLMKRYQMFMWVVLLVHIALSIWLMFFSTWDGILELITCLILFCANSQANYCWLLFYMFRCMLGFVERGSSLGLLIQTHKTSGSNTTAVVLLAVFWVFYIVAITVAFYTYREYKAFMVSPENAMGGMGRAYNYGPSQAVNNPNPANAGQYQRIGKFTDFWPLFRKSSSR